LAAAIIANEYQLHRYKIDLACVVSKYIGETEKNLQRLFSAAECGRAILLFDEANALFGKRGEVNDSQARYAIIELAYLLHRMAGDPDRMILTTNRKEDLDTAYLRHIRRIARFPLPDAQLRAPVWLHRLH